MTFPSTNLGDHSLPRMGRRTRAQWRGPRRGFTLTELMVAMTGGLVVSIAVFVLARQASRFYSREGRIASATLTSVVGFERLRADIARAGYMATPNIRRDPLVCGGPRASTANWPAYMAHFQSVLIEPLTVTSGQLPSAFGGNPVTPHRITLVGNYTNAEQFEVRDIIEVGITYEVFLAVASRAMQRLAGGVVTSVPAATLSRVFPTGRAVRIVDPSGRQHYGQINGVIGGTQPRVVLVKDGPTLQPRQSGGCGIIGPDTGALINPVNIVRYTLKSLDGHPTYDTMYEGGSQYDPDSRVDLVREEVPMDGAGVISGTEELVSEYAVNLDFVLTAVKDSTTGSLEVVPKYWAQTTVGDSMDLNTPVLSPPQQLRSIAATLAVRSREADRGAGFGGSGPLLRFGVGPGGGQPYARVRTVTAQIALSNQLGVRWW